MFGLPTIPGNRSDKILYVTWALNTVTWKELDKICLITMFIFFAAVDSCTAIRVVQHSSTVQSTNERSEMIHWVNFTHRTFNYDSGVNFNHRTAHVLLLLNVICLKWKYNAFQSVMINKILIAWILAHICICTVLTHNRTNEIVMLSLYVAASLYILFKPVHKCVVYVPWNRMMNDNLENSHINLQEAMRISASGSIEKVLPSRPLEVSESCSQCKSQHINITFTCIVARVGVLTFGHFITSWTHQRHPPSWFNQTTKIFYYSLWIKKELVATVRVQLPVSLSCGTKEKTTDTQVFLMVIGDGGY